MEGYSEYCAKCKNVLCKTQVDGKKLMSIIRLIKTKALEKM